MMRPEKIMSGFQTGADEGGLRGAFILGIPTGGWIARGLRREKGLVVKPSEMEMYNLKECGTYAYYMRTLLNVQWGTGTVLFGDMTSAGSALTIKYCNSNNKPFKMNPGAEELREWVETNNIKILNVAGNRESRNPGICVRVEGLIVEAFK